MYCSDALEQSENVNWKLLARDGSTVDAIKWLRNNNPYGLGLKEAKDTVDEYNRRRAYCKTPAPTAQHTVMLAALEAAHSPPTPLEEAAQPPAAPTKEELLESALEFIWSSPDFTLEGMRKAFAAVPDP